jgi:hypothetical protein
MRLFFGRWRLGVLLQRLKRHHRRAQRLPRGQSSSASLVRCPASSLVQRGSNKLRNGSEVILPALFWRLKLPLRRWRVILSSCAAGISLVSLSASVAHLAEEKRSRITGFENSQLAQATLVGSPQRERSHVGAATHPSPPIARR